MSKVSSDYSCCVAPDSKKLTVPCESLDVLDSVVRSLLRALGVLRTHPETSIGWNTEARARASMIGGTLQGTSCCILPSTALSLGGGESSDRILSKRLPALLVSVELSVSAPYGPGDFSSNHCQSPVSFAAREKWLFFSG